jgi:flagellar hook assembly protein FlgD
MSERKYFYLCPSLNPKKTMKVFNLKITTLLATICLLFSNYELSATVAPASTDGTVTFSVLTVSNGATYSPKNVLAIWVKDAQGNFVISRKVMAANRKQHLVKWVASSGNNSVNATTGATLSNHQTHTITWDCRDVSGNLVPDGTYEIWVEYTSRNSAVAALSGHLPKWHLPKGSM